MAFFTVAAAVVLVLLGMRHLRKGLDLLAGRRLAHWIGAAATNRGKAFLGGAALGAAVPSSTSAALLSVRLTQDSGLTGPMTLAVLLGANVGITASVQLLGLGLHGFAFHLIATGGAAYLFAKRPGLRGGGQALLAFGFIFLAMQILSETSAEMAASPELADLFAALGNFPLPLALGTALLAVALQSSTATIALGIGLGQAGLIGPGALLAWVAGANLGTSLTVCLAGWATPEGRRLALGNLLPRLALLGALIWAGEPLAQALSEIYGGEGTRLAADLHTGFNLAAALLGLALLRPLDRLGGWLAGEAPATGKERRMRLSRSLLQSPNLALHHACREMLPLFDDLRQMLKAARGVGMEGHPEDFTEVDRLQAGLVQAREELGDYLSRLDAGALDPGESRWKSVLVDYSHELVAAGVVVRRDLTDAALRLASAKPPVPGEARDELREIFVQGSLRLEEATQLLTTRDPEAAARFIRGKERFSGRCRRCQRNFQRIGEAAGDAAFVPHYIDHLNCLRRFNSHLTSVAYLMLPEREREREDEESG